MLEYDWVIHDHIVGMHAQDNPRLNLVGHQKEQLDYN